MTEREATCKFRCPTALEMAETILHRVDLLSDFDREIANKGVVYVRGYEIGVDKGDLKEFRAALKSLSHVRRRIVASAADTREQIAREKEARRA